jgi:hypothetical protein
MTLKKVMLSWSSKLPKPLTTAIFTVVFTIYSESATPEIVTNFDDVGSFFILG